MANPDVSSCARPQKVRLWCHTQGLRCGSRGRQRVAAGGAACIPRRVIYGGIKKADMETSVPVFNSVFQTVNDPRLRPNGS